MEIAAGTAIQPALQTALPAVSYATAAGSPDTFLSSAVALRPRIALLSDVLPIAISGALTTDTAANLATDGGIAVPLE